MRIYVASSWRNGQQPAVVKLLRELGHQVYDFRHPDPDNPESGGFAWKELRPESGWSPEALKSALGHERAIDGFHRDMDALEAADATLLVLPCGRSAHLELGFAVAEAQRTAVLLAPDADGHFEPELMYLMVDDLLVSMDEVAKWAGKDDRS